MQIIADNLQPLSRSVATALEKLDPGPLQDIALKCEKAGARLLDINPGYLSKKNRRRMTFMVEAVQEATDLRLVLDSPDPEILAHGLAVCKKPPIINALSMDQKRIDRILPLALESGADLVILIMDERSVSPVMLDEKMALAIELREICLAAGMPHDRLIFDPVVPTLQGPDAFSHVGQAVEFIRLLSAGAVFGESARTMIGLSNLRSGQRDLLPARLDEVCLSMSAGAGLAYALINVFQDQNMLTAGTINQFK